MKKNEIKEEKNIFKDKNNGSVLWERNTPNNKFTRSIYDKRYINKKINVKPKNKNQINLNNINSPYKEIRYDNESYPSTFNNYNINNIVFTQLFKNSNYKKNSFEDKDKKNTNIASTSSLTSLFSIQTDNSNKANNNLFKNKNKGNEYITKSNNNLSHISKLKKNADISKSNNNIIIKKSKNKNYLNSIRLIKKRNKNNNKENHIQKNEEKKEVHNYNISKNNKKDDNPKIYENEIKPRKELAVIRRINKKIENYKKNGPQVYQISKKHNNRFENNNNLNYYKGNNYQFYSFRRLSEIQKRSKSNNSNNKKTCVSKSKSNNSLYRNIQKRNKSFKHF